MRVLIIDSGSKNIKYVLERIPGGTPLSIFSNFEEAALDIEENGNEAILIFDFDEMKSELNFITERILKDYTEVRRFYVSSEMNAAQLREHQQTSEGADGYLKIPFKSKLLVNIFSAYALEGLEPNEVPEDDGAKSVLESQGMNPDDVIGEQEISSKIQSHFDYAFGTQSESDSDGLDFGPDGGLESENSIDLGGDTEDEVAIDLSAPAVEATEELSFSSDETQPEVDLSGGTDTDEIDLSGAGDDGGLDLGGDDAPVDELDLSGGAEDEIDLSGATDDGGLDLGGDDAPVEELDLGGADDGALDLGGDDVPVDELDLSGGDESTADDIQSQLDENTDSDFIADLSADNQTNSEGLSDHAKTQLTELDDYLTATADEIAPNPLEDEEGLSNETMDISFDTQAEGPDDDLPNLTPSDADLEEPDLPGMSVPSSSPEEYVQDFETQASDESGVTHSEPVTSSPAASHHSMSHNTEELSRLAETIQNLREDRDALLERLNKYDNQEDYSKQESLGVKSELDEKKIELKILKRKYEEQIDEFQYKLKLSDQKKEMAIEKQKQLLEDVEKLNQKVRLDIKRIQSRERELENQLELIKADADIQLKNRDRMILELKRRIDSLEFEMETITLQEQKHINARVDLEGKLGSVMSTLRSALTLLDEVDAPEIEEFKKNLDI